MWLEGWESLTVSHHPEKFGNNNYFDKWDLVFLIYHITSHNHLLKWSCYFMPLILITVILDMMASDIVVVEMKHFWFVCWSQKTTCKRLIVSHQLATCNGQKPYGSWDVMYLIYQLTSCDHAFRRLRGLYL